jgi:hypothetical protein
MEQGLNESGFLVCKFIFRVSSEGFVRLLLLNPLSGCQGSLPCRGMTKKRQMKTMVSLMTKILLSPRLKTRLDRSPNALFMLLASRLYDVSIALLSGCSETNTWI